MNTILKIAKAEWKTLFYSPVAWLVLFLFCVACGVAFAIPLQYAWRLQVFNFLADDTWPGAIMGGLTKQLVGDPSGQLAAYFFLFLPLLTMGILSREVNTGTIKLLYSSPIGVRDIVLGKFLGLLFLVFKLILFLATIFAIIPNLIIHVDALQYISTILGLLLLASAYIAIGIFVSSLTSYQIVAGVLTFLVFFVLSTIDSLWQQYDFIRDLTYFLALGNRTGNFLKGLVTSRDVCYFILIAILFLGFTIIKLKSTQESSPWIVPARRYLLLLFIILCAGYLSSIPGKVLYWDTTAQQTNTLHPDVQAVIKEMDGSPLTITLYTNLLGENVKHGLPQNRNTYIWKIWDQYRRFYPNMVFKYEYFYDLRDEQKDGLLARMNMERIEQFRDKRAKEFGIRPSLFKSPAEIRKLVDITEEQSFLVMKLQYKDKEAWLRTYGDPKVWHDPGNFAGSIKRLTRTTPNLIFTTGNYERSPFKIGAREYSESITAKGSRTALINHGIDCDTIALSSKDLPGNCDLLVIADPRSKLPDIEAQKVNDYIKNGGNALLLGEPGKTDNLNAILAPVGIQLDEGIIVNTNKDEMPHFFSGLITEAGAFMSGETMLKHYRLTKKGIPVTTVVGSTSITQTSINDFKTESILELTGDPDVWIEKGHLVVDSAAPVFVAAEGDFRKAKYDIALKMQRLTSEGEQRLIVTGDADMLSKDRLDMKIGVSYYSWLLDNQYPTYLNLSAAEDIYLKSRPTLIKAVSVTYIYIIPALVLFTGVIILTRRKRK